MINVKDRIADALGPSFSDLPMVEPITEFMNIPIVYSEMFRILCEETLREFDDPDDF